MGPLDKIPASVRHTIIVLLAAVLTTASQAVANHQTEGGFTLTDALWGLGAAVITQLLLWVTPLTQQYGVGAQVPPVEPVIADTPPGD